MVQGSVSRWLEGLKAGEEAAAQNVWDHYCEQLVRLARKKLPANRRRVADEEDLALSAFGSLCRGAQEGRFPNLATRDNLWSLLVFITAQKVADRLAHDLAQKRGGGRVRGHSAVKGANDSDRAKDFDGLFGKEPGPATLAQWLEEYERLLDRLNDKLLREIAVMRVEGFTVDEIATKLNRAKRTVARKLELIRKIWLAEAMSSGK
jgi:DNA-directed RNA polymerase specialized sigma24 family protein